MADRYWVGGTGNWVSTNTTNWSATSGGSGGASFPTASDNVFFNASSGTGTVTITNLTVSCLNLDCTGYTGTLTGSSAVTIDVYGSCTLVSGMTFSSSLSISLEGASGGTFSITSAGKTVNNLTIGQDASSGTYDFNDAVSFTGSLIANDLATVNTNNFAVTGGAVSSLFVGGTFNAGSSTINTRDFNCTGTFNGGTSNLYIAASSGTKSFGANTYYNVYVTGTISSVFGMSLSGAATFNDLTVDGNGSTGLSPVFLNDSFTVSGTFSCGTTSVSPASRVALLASPYNATITITAAAVSLGYVDFAGVSAAGASTPWTGTSLGDCGGNSNITFPASKNVYAVSSGWALSSGGSTSTANYPLPQDVIIVDESSGVSLTFPVGAFGDITCSSRTTPFTLSVSTGTIYFFGNVTFSSAITVSAFGNIPVAFRSRTNKTITSAGVSWGTTYFLFQGMTTLADALTSAATGVVTPSLASGTLNLDGKTLTVSANLFSVSGSTTRTLAFGSGGVLQLAATSFSASTTTNLSVSGIGTINLASSGSKSFTGGSFSYTGITLNQGGSGTLTISGSNSFKDLTATARPSTISITGGTTQTFENFTLSGISGSLVTVQSTNTNAYNFVKTGSSGINTDYLSFSRCTATPLLTWYVGANSVNAGNNTNLLFTARPGNFLIMMC